MSTETPLVILFCALPEEAAPVLRRMNETIDVTPDGAPHLKAMAGRLGGCRVWHVSSGEGSSRAARAIAWLDEDMPEVPLIAYGVAGAVTDDLNLGDVVVASTVESSPGSAPLLDVSDSFPTGEALDLLLEGVVKGAFLTVDRPLVSRAEKADAAQRSASGCRSVCVEMEAYPLARAAVSSGRLVLFLRVISDTSREALPGFLARCRTEDGATDVPRVAWNAALRPWSWGPLLRLSGRVSRGSESLAARLEAICGVMSRRSSKAG